MLEVQDGEAKKSFTVHKPFLAYYSDTFAASFENDHSRSGGSRIFNSSIFIGIETYFLPTTPKALGVFIEQIFGTYSDEDFGTFQDFLDIWILAEYLEAPVIHNRAMSEIFHACCGDYHFHRKCQPWKELKYVYEEKTPENKLRDTIIDTCCYWEAPHKNFHNKNIDLFTAEILLDLCDGYPRMVRREQQLKGKDWTFSEHL